MSEPRYLSGPPDPAARHCGRDRLDEHAKACERPCVCGGDGPCTHCECAFACDPSGEACACDCAECSLARAHEHDVELELAQEDDA